MENLVKRTVGFDVKKLTEKGSFSGYGSVFGVVDHYGEVVVAGAFKKSLREWKKQGKMPKLLWQHNPSQVIGKFTLMREDETGLYVEGQLFVDSIALAKEAYTLLSEEAIDGLSIGFMVRDSDWDEKKGCRLLKEIDLWETSLVTFPANPAATVTGVKSFDGGTIRDYENHLQAMGHSKKEATLIASKCFDAVMATRDAGGSGNNGSQPVVGEPHAAEIKLLLEALHQRGKALTN